MPSFPMLALVIVALLAAASAFLLPALDASLPGGSIAWQMAAVMVALAAALLARRRVAAGAPEPAAGLARALALAAVLLALVWAGGVAFLWLIWPR